MTYITGKHLPRRTFLRGMGATVALPFLDAMVPAGRSTALAATADKTRLICIEEVHGLAGCNNWGATKFLFAPETTGPRLHAGARQPVEHARSLPRLPDDRQQHRRAHGRSVRAAGNRRRPLPLERGVPDPVAPEADAGLGHLRRHLARSDVREALRPDHAAAVDAVLHREPRSGGRLHLQLLLRLHRLDQLGVAERAAADDSRPARRLRHAVRRGRHGGGSRGAPRDAPQHPRLDSAARSSASTVARHRRPHALDRYLDNVREIERRIQRVEARNNAAAKRARCPTRRPACPTRSPST